MAFVQVIDCKTNRVEELNRLMDDWASQTQGKRTATHAIVGKDRSDPTHVVEIVEFPSYEEAMRNSRLPETDRIFREMVELCEAPPQFTDLDVVRDEQLNKAAARRVFEELMNRRNLGLFDELYAPGYVEHDQAAPTDLDLAGAKENYQKYINAFEPQMTVESQVAEGNLVTIRWTASGTHRGTFEGLEATGRPVRVVGQTTFRFSDTGKIEEGWWNWDNLGLLTQLGIVEV